MHFSLATTLPKSIVHHVSQSASRMRESLVRRWTDYQLSRPYPFQESEESLGHYGERIASIYLQRKGYFILERSFRAKSGEIDLIAVWRKRVIVFVEVKTWVDVWGDAGGPSDAVDEAKQAKITRTALVYMKRHLLLETPGRIDVVEILFDPVTREPAIRHFENAFDAVGAFQMFS